MGTHVTRGAFAWKGAAAAGCAAALSVLAAQVPQTAPEAVRLVILNETAQVINPRLFGHFLERPSWGERGVEAAYAEEHEGLHPDVLMLMKRMTIPVIRFPGGTDIDYMAWTDLIDNAPGRPSPSRPTASVGHTGEQVSNRFGYDEYFSLRDTLRCETIIVVNFFDAFLKRKPLRDAAIDAVGLLAYCNARAGDPLPDGMTDWPAVRAANGHPDPFGADYIQIGNETFALFRWKKDLLDEAGIEDIPEWYAACVAEYIRVIRAIDPDIPILVDSVNREINDAVMAAAGADIAFLVNHYYMPMSMKRIERDGIPVEAETLTPEEVWYAWVGTPNAYDAQGQSELRDFHVAYAREHGKPLAVTEWNWNGWWTGSKPRQEMPEAAFAKAIGAAGFLHAFMRSDAATLACQSMLVGESWGITGIRVDPSFERAPHLLPTARIVDFYAKHHGSRRLVQRLDGVPVYRQPLRLGGIMPADSIAYVDIVTTADDDRMYVHVINRSRDMAFPLEVDTKAFCMKGNVSVTCLRAAGTSEPATFDFHDGRFTVLLEARSVTLLEIDLGDGPNTTKEEGR